MTWEEHEEEHCPEIDFHPEPDEIFETCRTYEQAYKEKDYYEQGYEDGNTSSLAVVQYQDLYFVVYVNSDAAEIKFKSRE